MADIKLWKSVGNSNSCAASSCFTRWRSWEKCTSIVQFEVRKEAEKGKMKIPLVPQNKLGNFQGSLVNGPIGMKNIMLDSQEHNT